MAGIVNLIDPNKSNINNSIVNGIPQYQDMYITVELTAIRRGRTVLSTELNTDVTKFDRGGFNNGTLISFLGQNQDPNNKAHFNKFTTNFYDGSTSNDKTYESFGIEKIDVLINSSFIPQVDIDFIDIRGLSFFNRKNSPYKILFDFPPPIFYLTIKGYYGKAITYQLHLVKYNTEFKSETGNYHISGKFIAITYAPLTDILFRYIIQAPLINNKNVTLTPDSSTRPKNTLDLILKLENIYSEIPNKIKTDVDNVRYENAQKKINQYNQVLEIIYNFNNIDNLNINTVGKPKLFTYDNTPDSESQGEIVLLNSFSEYDKYLKSYQTVDLQRNVTKKIYIGYLLEIVNNDINIINERNALIKKTLNEYKNNVISKSKSIVITINDNDIKNANEIKDRKGAEVYDEAKYIKYIGIDITDYYIKIFKNKLTLEEQKEASLNDLNQKINNMVHEKLGMLPTIYNIFEILLNDVDTFFNVLRKTSRDAEEHHKKHKTQIVNDGTYKDVKNTNNPKIFPFPLIIRKSTFCNQIKEERIAPIDISERLGNDPFPELKLVQDFIDSFLKYQRIYQQATLKDEKTSEGDYKWIPITPVDSKLFGNIESPYYGIDTDSDVNQQTINTKSDNRLTQVYNVLLKRFYVLSQNSIAYSFYGVRNISSNNRFLYDISKTTRDEYVKLYAQSEALNLVNSMINENYLKLIEQNSQQNDNSNKLNNNFYAYLNNNLNDLYTNNTNEFYNITNTDSFYRDKEDNSYIGLNVIPTNQIVLKDGNSSSNNDFDVFINNNKTKFINRFLKNSGEIPEETFSFTKENIIYRKDSEIFDNNKYNTKFLSRPQVFWKNNENNLIDFYDPTENYDSVYDLTFRIIIDSIDRIEKKDPFNYNNLIESLSNNGNQYFFNQNINVAKKTSIESKHNTSLLSIWSNILSLYDIEIYDDIIKIDNGRVKNQKLTALVYLSTFGHTLGAFNYFPYQLNGDYFTTPSIIEIPEFVLLYMGLLVGVEKEDSFWNEIYDFFVNGSGKNIKNGGVLIFADIYDINTYLSDNDKRFLRERFENWFINDFNVLSQEVNSLYQIINGNTETNSTGLFIESCGDKATLTIPINNLNVTFETKQRLRRCKANLYEEQLNENGDYRNVLNGLINRVGLVCYNEITFRYIKTPTPTTYTSLQELNNNNDIKEVNDLFFSTFFNEVKLRIKDRLRNLQQQADEFRGSTRDHDMLTQTYYSFKNINDKWLAGLNNSNIRSGYPFKTNKNQGLISQFAFVDRAMKPIGDTIIDPKILIDLKDSPDTTIFTVISQLLSTNGFEFFPLQNFLKFTENEWENSFKIDTGNIQKQYPVFVCMYIGGSSSYPTGINNFTDFEDDGISDLQNPGVGDFLSGDCEELDSDKDKQLETKETKGDLYSEIRAFRVRYGEQNQNMFFNIGIDSKEYPETNESIQILSRLAGDNREQAPVSKAQNLYNLYENRAYRATVDGMGNAMIQPTQYFQLENIPLFNGAYIILSVSHSIIPNKMTTKFSGTKILKYPMPRVLNPAAIVGFEGGNTNRTNSGEISSEDVTLGVGTAGNPAQAKYNSMYTLEIN